ncbi:MAG: H(+)-transporting ATPase [Candidatus Omnitrophota bacterium]|nr:H(+)-transporting ATPase [Candidatus Omnitrophota bacterium]
MRTILIITLMIATIMGPSAVIGLIAYGSIRALGRNPSAAPKILLAMIIALVFAEAVAVVSLLVLFQLFSG